MYCKNHADNEAHGQPVKLRFGKRIAALLLALCFLVSFVQNIAFKSAFATEDVSGSDAVVVSSSDAEEATSGSDKKTSVGVDVSKSDAVDVSESCTSATVSENDTTEPVSETDSTSSGSDVLVMNTEASTEVPSDNLQITMTTSGDTLSFSVYGTESENNDPNAEVYGPENMYIDWGNGNKTGPYTGAAVSGNPVGTVKIYADGDITGIFCSEQSLTSIKFVNCPKLTDIDCSFNNLTELDVSELSMLESIDCWSNEITVLDVTNNEYLEWLNCSENNLTRLNVTNCPSLVTLECFGNNISELDVSNCIELFRFFCGDNNLSSLDISQNSDLLELDCEHNSISVLDISSCSPYAFFCGSNNLTELDLSSQVNLEYFGCANNNISAIDLSDCENLCHIECDGNKLTFSELRAADGALLYDGELGEYIYAPQGKVFVAEKIALNETIDLSSEYNAHNTETVYTWYNAADNTALATQPTNNGGVFTFDENHVGMTLFCTMTNASLPDLTLYTTDVKIAAIPLSSVAIDNTSPMVGDTLTAAINPAEATVTYQWYADGVSITGATENSYTVTNAEIGKAITVTATGTGSYTGTVTSEATDAVLNGEFTTENETNDSDLIVDAQPEEDTVFVDENGNLIGIGKLMLVVGDVAGNTKKTVLEAVEEYNKRFNSDSDSYALYDISIEDEKGKKIEIIDGRIKITLKIPDNCPGNGKDYTFTLYHYDEDTGTLEIIPITLSNGKSHYSFYADDFSPYILVWDKIGGEVMGESDSVTPETGDNSNIAFVTAICIASFLLMAACIIGNIVVYRKKHNVE